jgi:hypothetical protein
VARIPSAPVFVSMLLAAAAALAACAPDADTNTLTGGNDIVSGKRPSSKDATAKNGAGALPDIKAKDYFRDTVQKSLAGTCGTCHASGPGPVWIVPSDVEKSYSLQFQRGYVSRTSALLKKGAHSTGAPSLTPTQEGIYATWVELEMKERGDKAPDAVLTKLAGCIDKAKFDAIGWDKLVTTPRNADNNPQKQNENTDECTGCNNKQCSGCHSADAATGFVMAVGNDVFPEDQTFNDTKSISPPYMQKYFGLDVNGDPIPSKAIKAKSDNTVNIAKAYQHPMFTLSPEMEQGISAFVLDAIGKYNTGKYGP